MAVSLQAPTTACTGLTELFFEDTENLEVVFSCRTVCVNCRMFDKCLNYSVENYPDVPDGIFGGYPPSARKRMYEGTLEVFDWRPTWDESTRTLEGLPTGEVCPHTNLRPGRFGKVCDACGQRVRRIKR